MELAIGYLRQSTQKQQSLEAQKTEIQRLAKKHGFKDITFFYDKKTGRNTKRTGYQQIVNLIKQGDCQILCCYRLNRLHRNLKNSIALINLCQKYHVNLLSVCDGYFDTKSAFDCFKLNIFASFAELESDNIGEQVRNGIKEKARQGKLITTHAPFGYHYQNGTFVINDYEAPTVKVVYDYYTQGMGYKKISQKLEADNKLINRKPYQVRNIIINPNYCGRIINKYGQFNKMIPPIISTSKYEQAQTIRKQKHVRRTPSDNQLKQKIKCPCCGATLTNMTVRKSKHIIRYYVCPKNMNESRFVCKFKGINAKKLENEILDTCKVFFQSDRAYQKINTSIKKHLKLQRNSAKKNLITQEQLIDKLAKGIISAEVFKKQSEALLKPTPVIFSNNENIKSVFQNTIQQKLTLALLHPHIDEVFITKDKTLSGVYFKNDPLNIVSRAEDYLPTSI